MLVSPPPISVVTAHLDTPVPGRPWVPRCMCSPQPSLVMFTREALCRAKGQSMRLKNLKITPNRVRFMLKIHHSWLWHNDSVGNWSFEKVLPGDLTKQAPWFLGDHWTRGRLLVTVACLGEFLTTRPLACCLAGG